MKEIVINIIYLIVLRWNILEIGIQLVGMKQKHIVKV